MQQEQKLSFYKDGYVVIRNAVNQDLIDKAKQLINCDIGKAYSGPREKAKWESTVQSNAHITNLFNASSAYQCASDLIGKRLKQLFGAQVALRFPGDSCSAIGFQPVPWWNSSWHIDGFHSPDNGIPKGEVHNFTLLVGIILSDVPDEFSGNFTVYPKSHHVTEQYFNEVGLKDVQQNGLESFDKLPLCKPVQITGKAGDVIFAHYNLAHTVAPNCSTDIRYGIYFRINVREQRTSEEALKSIWLDYPGLTDIVKQEARNKPQLLKEATIGERIGAIYADERSKLDRSNLKTFNSNLEQLRKQADQLFESKQYAQAVPLFDQLISESPDEYWTLVKAAVCCTWGSPPNHTKGEKYALMSIELSPTTLNGYCLVAQSLKEQKKYDQVAPWVEKMLRLTPQEDEAQPVLDGLATARDALVQIDQTDQLTPLVELAISQYPKLAPKINQALEELIVAKLWKEAHKWFATPVKDFNYGRSLFSGIVAKKPEDYWATLCLGGCYTWDKQPREGEPYIRKAITIDSNIPNGHALLSQTLLWQGKGSNVVDVVTNMINNHTFPTVFKEQDHAAKIIEALETLRNVTGKDVKFNQLVATSKTKWPLLTEQLNKL